jgi:hypothetical protein
MSAPKEIDRDDVLQELDFRVPPGKSVNGIGWVLDELAELDILKFREPADDPSKDLVGTLRREDKGDEFAVYLKAGSPAGATWVLVYTSEPGVLADRFPDEFVAGFPIVGSVSGTPAADLEAERKLEAIPEWEQELIREDYEKRQQREPRVFSSDEPEPPADVTVLEKMDYPSNRGLPYTKRGAFGWVNCESPDADTSQVHGFNWPPGHDMKFREVTA